MSDYYDVLTEFQAQSKDPDWDSVCWMPLVDCPGGHITIEQKLAGPVSSAARTADLELRNAGMQRKSAAYHELARAKGYEDMPALYAGDKSEINPL